MKKSRRIVKKMSKKSLINKKALRYIIANSNALYHIAKLAGVKFEAHMNMTTVDPANVVSFVKNNYPDIIRHVPDINFYQLIRKKKCLPSKTQRYCCEVLKERGGGGTVTLVGIRA